MQGLKLYDYSARQYDPAVCQFTSMDPLCEKYYHLSPYIYCGGNPVNRIDPDGRKVKPIGDNTLDLIKMTLPKDSREYVVLDDAGFIDYNILKQYSGNSENFRSLMVLSADNLEIEISQASKYEYINPSGDLFEKNMSYNGIDDFLIDNDIQYVSGLTTGEDAFAGKTLFPDRDGAENSPNTKLQIIVNDKLTPMGKIETIAHEAYGHAKLYLINGHNHIDASHQAKDMRETNTLLREMIINARKEAVKNAQR